EVGKAAAERARFEPVGPGQQAVQVVAAVLEPVEERTAAGVLLPRAHLEPGWRSAVVPAHEHAQLAAGGRPPAGSERQLAAVLRPVALLGDRHLLAAHAPQQQAPWTRRQAGEREDTVGADSRERAVAPGGRDELDARAVEGRAVRPERAPAQRAARLEE